MKQDVEIKENVEIERDIEQDDAKESEQYDAEFNTLIAESVTPSLRVSARSNKGVAGKRYDEFFSIK